MDAGCADAFASKPAPTGVGCAIRFSSHQWDSVGAWLARDGVGSANLDAGCADVIASKLAHRLLGDLLEVAVEHVVVAAVGHGVQLEAAIEPCTAVPGQWRPDEVGAAHGRHA